MVSIIHHHPPSGPCRMSTTDKKRRTATAAAELQVQKSPAEFFAEHQAIAGFDNLGKSLYTTIRELVENGLDACEAVHVLPQISVHVHEYNQAELNQLTTEDIRIATNDDNSFHQSLNERDTASHERIDLELFQKKGRKSSLRKDEDEVDVLIETNQSTSKVSSRSKKSTESSHKPNQYYLVTVTDNGGGMSHSAIPELMGRVLSGSKYGVRQTRGKFGLGAKMALIWAKKSTGHPIHILTVHHGRTSTGTGRDGNAAAAAASSKLSSCILDIDIFKNEPRVIEHTQILNNTQRVGTTVRVLIAGNWTTYKSRIVQYLQQLAIITPYAALSLTYTTTMGSQRKNLCLSYDRRSEQMPPTPVTIQHHPASVNNVIVQQLIQHTKTKNLVAFLTKELSAVSVPLAKRLVAELSSLGLTESMSPATLTDAQITRLVQLFHQVQLFRPPDGSCLSPLGEYNLNLGIRKVLDPEIVATTCDKVSAYEGHPFVIEAAVSLGGKNVKEGITVHRFANRIPLLFEGGADVATRVALTKIKWANYKIDYKRDKIGVFVSIVSTKIPFKGTSKEYIGDDATEIHQSVKRALQSCCQQLRLHLTKRNALKDAKTRKSKLIKYVPDVGRSLFALLDGMRQRKRGQEEDVTRSIVAPGKRLRLDDSTSNQMIQRIERLEVTEEAIQSCLVQAIEAENPELDGAATKEVDMAAKDATPLYIVPLYNLDDSSHDIETPWFTFRPIFPCRRATTLPFPFDETVRAHD